MTGIEPFEDDDLAMIPQTPVELTVADVQSVDPAGAAAEQDVGEAAGRGAKVERHQAFGVEAEVVEAMGDGSGTAMIDGKMQDDATVKQCKVMIDLAQMLAEGDPELKAAYAF